MEDGTGKMYVQFYSIPEEINSASANPCKNAIRILQCAEEYCFLMNSRIQKIESYCLCYDICKNNVCGKCMEFNTLTTIGL